MDWLGRLIERRLSRKPSPLHLALQCLPQPDRDIFKLTAVQSLTTAEAAGQLGISVEEVEQGLARALVILDKNSESWGS